MYTCANPEYLFFPGRGYREIIFFPGGFHAYPCEFYNLKEIRIFQGRGKSLTYLYSLALYTAYHWYQCILINEQYILKSKVTVMLKMHNYAILTVHAQILINHHYMYVLHKINKKVHIYTTIIYTEALINTQLYTVCIINIEHNHCHETWL